MEHQERSDYGNGGSGQGFMAGLLVGGLIGALFAIVLAPQSGEETRDLLRGKAEEAKGRAADLAYDLRNRASSVAETLKTQADQWGQKSRNLIDSARGQVSGAVDEGKRAAEAKMNELNEADDRRSALGDE